MGNMSSVAEIIVGLAISEAKRYDCAVASELHLLSAIRRWHEEHFDHKFPEVAKTILKALSQARGDSIKRPVLKSDLETRMIDVKAIDDVWTLAAYLLQETKDLRDRASSAQSPSMTFQTQIKEIPTDVPVDSVNVQSSKTLDPLPFGINESLIERIAKFANCSIADTTTKILNDALTVAKIITNKEIDGLKEMIEKDSGLHFNTLEGASNLSNFINELSLLSGVSASKYATQVAMALVEVAEWAASIDDEVTKEETDRIDGVRMKLREQLGDRIDTESAAILAFEGKFANLIGMESVKTDLRKRLDFLVVNKRREKRGLKADVHRMHMAFLGNPGTGKTTVARLFGELLNETGLLPTNKFVETDRSGLVGEHVGATEIKTLNVINSADGGVLFIDEAYALDDGYSSQKGFGYEATSVLVKQMEDRRERLVVILAGYTEPTNDYLSINPGLKSRIPTTINFPDYSIDELKQIALRIALKRDLLLSESTILKISEFVEMQKNKDGFGNAREIENILEHAQRSSINRLSKLGNLATESEIRTILPEDIPKISSLKKKTFGFSPTTNH